MSVGFVYIISNPGMPDLIKIGFTTGELEKRLRELRATGVAYPFLLEAAVRVSHPESVERKLHDDFREQRVAEDREFFRIAPSQVLMRLVQLAVEAQYQPSAIAGNAVKGAYEDLAADEESIISILAGRRDGADVSEIVRYRDHGSELEALYRVSELERKGYIEKVGRGGDTYRLANRGLRYLIEIKPPWFST